jgi:hypothetical protein
MPQPLMSDKPLLVVPNPFCVPLDRRGRPCGLVQYDPEHVSGPPRYIGGDLDVKVIERRELTFRTKDHRKSKLDVMAMFDVAPLQIVDSAYHRQMVKDGGLVAADESTAKRCGVEFASPPSVIEKARAAAVAAWVAQHGEEPAQDAWAKQMKVPASPAAGAKGAPKAPAAPKGGDA